MLTKAIFLLMFLNLVLPSNCDDELLSRPRKEDMTCSSNDGCDASATLDCDALFSPKAGKKPEEILLPLGDVLLDEVHAAWKNSDKMFFVESAGNKFLTTRQVFTSH